MPEIPVYQERVGIDGPSTPTPQIKPMGPESAGVNISDAASKLGGAVERLGGQMGEILAAKQRQDDEMEVNKRAASVSRQLQDMSLGENGWLTRQGENAIGITHAGKDSFDAKASKLKDEMAYGLPTHVAKKAAQAADALINSHRNAIISHEAQQTKVAREQAALSLLGEAKSSFAIDPDADSRNHLLQKAQATMAEQLKANGANEETIYRNQDELADKFVNNAVQANIENPEKAKAIYEASKHLMSKDAALETKALIDGKMIHVTGLSMFGEFASNPKMGVQNADGSLNMLEADRHVDALPDDKYSTVQKDSIKKIIAQEDQQASRRLDEKNSGNSKFFFSEASKPNVTIDEQNKLAHTYAATLRNGKVDGNDLRKKLDFAELVNKQADANTDPGVYTQIHTGINDGSINGIDEINQAMEQGFLSKRSAGQLIMFRNSGKTQAMQNAWKKTDASIDEMLTDPNERKGMKASLREQAIEGKVYNPVALDDLLKKNTSTIKTGAPGFFGYYFGGKTDEYYKMAQALQENRAFVSAMGGTEPAYRLTVEMGGPQVFSAGSPQSIAVLELIKAGVKPNQIDKASIEAAMAQINARPK